MTDNNNSHPILKEIYFDDIHGKIKIHDSKGDDYECNLYGEKITKFLPQITGFIDFKLRNEMGHFDYPIIKDESSKIYHPQKSKKI